MVLHNRIIYNSCWVAIFLLMLSCGKDQDLVISEVPFIEFNSITPISVQEFDGPITFNIKYQDGDGDLGENNPNVKNLFLKDNRNGIIYDYRLQQLAPDDVQIPITGTFDIILNNTAITDGSDTQNATFDIYVVDRSGHKSNTITSTTLSVYK